MKKFLLMSCCWLLVFSVYAQQRTVTGRVTDGADGTPLPGVSVVIKGTNNGTVTDGDGNFSLSASNDDVLSFSFIGFEQQDITVGAQTSINVAMQGSINTLNEVVVIGYGEREKRDITGSISSVDSRQIEKSVSIAPELAMQGRMSGVFVSTAGGNPNARPTVLIRGQSTFNNAQPLYVVDGVPLLEFGNTTGGVESDIRGTVNILTLINPGDIESISVLKDAAAAAIYGARAGNGVILITTKKGKKGAPRVEFNASRGVQNFRKNYDVLNTQQFTQVYQEMFQNDYIYRTQQAPNADPAAPYIWDQFSIANGDYNPLQVFNPNTTDPNFSYLGNSATYDWQSELTNRDAALEDYSVRVSGGSETSDYYIGGGYSRTESPLVNNWLERYSLSANVNSKISKVIETGVLYRVTYNQALDNTRGDLQSAATVSPWQPIYDPNGPAGFARTTNISFEPNEDFDLSLADPGPFQNIVGRTDQYRTWGNESSSNVFAQMALGRTDYSLLKNFGTAYLQVEPLKGLKIRGSYSVDWTYIRRNEWDYSTQSVYFSETPGNPYNNQDGTAVGSYGERHSRNISLVSGLSVNYTKTFGNHNINVLLNAESQDFNYQFISGGSPQQYFQPEYRGIGGQQRFTSVGTIRDQKAIQGYIGRFSYNFKDKYYLDASFRRDGSSQYAPENRWGNFPGASAAWRISSEDFFRNSVNFIDDLKIRAGYGALGNSFPNGLGLSDFAYLSTVSTTADYSLGSGNGSATGRQVNAAFLPVLPNVDLSWERIKTLNVGVDGALLQNRLTFTIEYYNKLTDNIIQVVDLPGSSGFNAPVQFNVAKVRNSGVELELGYTHNIGDLQLNFSGNLTTVKNRVESLYGGFQRYASGIVEGQPIGFIYGYRVGGIFQTQAEIDAWRQSKTDVIGSNSQQPGDMWFVDVNGKPDPAKGEKYFSPVPDDTVDANDRTIIGNTVPGFFYGFNIGARYKGFDLSVFFQGVGDVDKYNYARSAGESMDGTGLNFWSSVENRWRPERPSSTMPRAIYGDPNSNNRFSDRFVESAAFMRLKNVQIGYTLPSEVLKSLKVVNSFRIYASGTNLLTFTNWTGLDPEAVASTYDAQLNTTDRIPPTRVISLGINASF